MTGVIGESVRRFAFSLSFLAAKHTAAQRQAAARICAEAGTDFRRRRSQNVGLTPRLRIYVL